MSELSALNSALASDVETETTPDSAWMSRSFSDDIGIQATCNGDSEVSSTDRKGSTNEEKIYVTVRLRPLNTKEIADRHFSIWECLNDKTVACLQCRPDRSNFPQSYVFDQVFKSETTTKEVYERGAKDLTLSALTGKNATIFAYGQTSSGKTYTMKGITENAADDIFCHIKQHHDHIFLLKFAALEIYNEVVVDLLKPENGPLRIMDDPVRGTVIEKLTEEIVRDESHLKSLLEVCDVHRQVGETALNDISSRSHQIVRLTIESSPRGAVEEGPIRSLMAVLNFVDLAGSERVSLTHSEGTTLKEGCFINRSLLTLSTVIRKLSDLNRSKVAHIPYRESKLTRILRNALGGNARTAIICTMSSSNKHLEQTRNTLFFASYAKEVTNRAQVNVVISDKDLIKQLKKEVALLEAQLRRSSISSQNSFDALLQEKDLQIQKMQEDIGKAFQLRDLAQSELASFRKQVEETKQASVQAPSVVDVEVSFPSLDKGKPANGKLHFKMNSYQKNGDLCKGLGDAEAKKDYLQQPWSEIRADIPSKLVSSASSILLDEIYKLEHLQNELAQDASRALEAVQKEVECLYLTQTDINSEAAMNVAKLQSEINEIYESRTTGASTKAFSGPPSDNFHSLKEDIQRAASKDLNNRVGDADTIEKMLEQMQIKTYDLQLPSLTASAHLNDKNNSKIQDSEGSYPDEDHGSATTPAQAEETIRNVYSYVTDLKERISKLQYQKQLLVHRVLELERDGSTDEAAAAGIVMATPTSLERWELEFDEKRKQIFLLWDACHVSIIHRSQFYLLFRGDPADAIYMEVELRRLTWLKEYFGLATSNKRHLQGEHGQSPASSMRALRRERESMARSFTARLTASEREEIYKQWGIPLNSKQRRVRLANMLWTNYQDEEHVQMSAELVSRVTALWNRSGPISKEMLQLTLSPSGHERTWFRWSPIATLFGLGTV